MNGFDVMRLSGSHCSVVGNVAALQAEVMAAVQYNDMLRAHALLQSYAHVEPTAFEVLSFSKQLLK